MSTATKFENVTCLGCGCGCDDLTVEVGDGRIVNVTPACPVGQAWFADGGVPAEVLLSGRPSTLEEAITEAARVLAGSAGRCLVYLGTDLSSQAQRVALRLADLLRATVDSATSSTAAEGLLAGQRRGRVTATLGQIRSRADAVVFWDVDPTERYPRYVARYAAKSAARFIASVSVGSDRSLSGADLSVRLEPGEEIAALSLMRAAVVGQTVTAASPAVTQMLELAGRLARARYAVIVHDADPAKPADSLRAEALIALAQALNTPTRAALSSLRAGGNRLGAEAVLTSQTGYPFGVDYARGFPIYEPRRRGLDRLSKTGFQAVLIVGTWPDGGPNPPSSKKVSTIVIGPRASQSGLQPRVAVDTGVAGIHEPGTGYRMDEVPLELTPVLPGIRSATEVLGAVADAVDRSLRRSSE
jgi:formylmethanofuran dehydrogenase subunit B